ncbi:hypothetical protein LCGC14_0425690 [marine sediment metagenome]|uniref:Uncharacterized protein n=1 Tax=marine sediment metagenome TaxID=412755 RepID=A0A0F9T7N8_9ZZZZ
MNAAEQTKPSNTAQDGVAPTNEKYKVYFALLNNGELRREMSSTVIPAMQRTKGVELVWENPGRTWANPISSNRCMIVKRFLETDCTHLLMIDDDVVPLHNPCEMVFIDRDVVASPALVRSAGQMLNWTAYVPHTAGEGYSAVDLDSIDDMFDVLEVAVVGTGCILVKREVLESIKQPFHSEFDEDGVQKYGTDFAFCRRATDAGYKVYTTTHRRCEHFKQIGFSDMTAWDTIDYFDHSNSKYNMPWGEYSITQRDWAFIQQYMPRRVPGQLSEPKVLEFGVGLSSLLLSETCKVISYETSPEYKEVIESKVKDAGGQNDLEIRLWDGINAPELLEGDNWHAEKFDLVFVDGPKERQKGGIGRDAAMRIASQVSDNIIVHDAGRDEEWIHQRKHLRGIFKLEKKSGSHITRCHYWKRRPKPVTINDVTAFAS